jgi:LPS-assembly protein
VALCLMVPLLSAGPGARRLKGQYPRCAATRADDAFRSVQESYTTASSGFDSPQTMAPRQGQDAAKTVTVLNGGQNIKADSQQKIRDIYRLIGHVEITYRQMKVTADEATFDSASSEVEARGHVIFTDPEAHLEADYTRYNLKTEIGDFSNAHGYVHPRIRPRPHILATENPFYLQATRVRRVSEDLFLLQGARLTTCENENKGWSVASRNARVEVGDKVVSHDDIFRLLGVPVFYSPLLVNSVKPAPRQTGFLLPEIGNSTQKGYIIGDGFFWAINPSVDLMLGLADYSKRGVARSGRFRARPSATSELTVDYFGVNDKADRSIRAAGQSVRAVGKADDLGHGFRGVLDIDYINTLAFRLTFASTFSQAVTSEVHQTGFVTKNFDAYSFNIYTERYQNFLSSQQTPGNSVIIRQTPSVSFSGIDKQVGDRPFYFSFDLSAAGVGRTQPGFTTPVLSERLDVHPQITLRLKPFWGFHLTPTLGLRATRYGASLRGAPLDRGLAELAVDLRPPSFERIFTRTYRGYRLKHVIEPDIRYRLVRVSDKEDIDNVVRYDQLDILTETNEVEYSLNNIIFARKDVPDDAPERPQAHELVSLRLSQKYFFDPTFGGALQPGNVVWQPAISLTGFAFAQGRRLSPVVSVLKFAPSSSYDTELRADLNPNGGGVLNAGITSHVRRGPLGLAFTEFFINRTATLLVAPPPSVSLSQLHSFNLLRTVATYGDVNRKGFSGAFGIDYNFAQGIAHQVVGQTSYNFGCFAVDLEYRRFALGNLRNENAFRIAISLANVGTFGNLRTRERLYIER